MNRITKVLSSLVAAVTLAVSVGSVASAATYDPCDVNMDGVVNVRDAQVIERYLVGNLKKMDYDKFDVDKSLVVDRLDEDYILAKATGNVCKNEYFSIKSLKYTTAPSVNLPIPDPDTLFDNGRTYMKYSYANKNVSEYTLTPSVKTLADISQAKSPLRAPVGKDDRYILTDNVDKGIVHIDMLGLDNKWYSGTGFIVGDHQIATSAHLVYDKDNNGWYKSLRIRTYDNNGKITNTLLTAVEAHMPKDYTKKEHELIDGQCKYDYALITVKQDLSSYTQFDLGMTYSVSESNYANIPLYITGCPGKVKGKSNTTNSLYTGEGRIIDKGYVSNDQLLNLFDLNVDIDASEGDSGSPIYAMIRSKVGSKSSFKYVAIGITSGESDEVGDYNVGTRVTKYLLQFYRNNPNINY